MRSEANQISYIFVLLLSILSLICSSMLIYRGELGFMKMIYSTEIQGGTNLTLTIPDKNLILVTNNETQVDIKKALNEKQIFTNIKLDQDSIIIESISNNTENILLHLSYFNKNWHINFNSNDKKIYMQPKQHFLKLKKIKALQKTKSILQLRLDPNGFGIASVKLSGDKILIEAPACNFNETKKLIQELGSISFKINDLLLDNVDIKNSHVQPYGNETYIVLELQNLDEFNDFISSHKGKNMSIILNQNQEHSKTLCIAELKNEYFMGPISISGLPTNEAIYINKLLQSGAIPIALEIEEERNVSTLLGEDILQSGLIKSCFAILSILISMIFLYGFLHGMIINITLILNLSLLVLFIGAFKITVTLSSIAGAVATAAMAVNANILIMEKLKDAKNETDSFQESLNYAYTGAITAIIDGSVTTLIASIIMYIFGMSFIKGYAIILIFGLCISFLTAVQCSKSLFNKIAEAKDAHFS